MGELRKKYSTPREALEARLPEMFFTEMDNGIFWRSLEEYKTGDVIEHKDNKYVVLYGWKWTEIAGVPIYCAELEPADITYENSRLKRRIETEKHGNS